jgi:hypothetical protein
VLRWIGARASNPVRPPCCSGAVAGTADGFTESRRVLTHSLSSTHTLIGAEGTWR